jgi:crotonobetainyl-CoA:carnitine CoA-transferase CaiB-like acyl-CoA transferase
MNITGEPDGPPTKSGLSIVDFSTGFVAALALVSGLFSSRSTGIGMGCHVSLFDTAIGMLTYPGVWHLNAGYRPKRLSRSAHPSLVPFQAFEAADGWLVIPCPRESLAASKCAVAPRITTPSATTARLANAGTAGVGRGRALPHIR